MKATANGCRRILRFSSHFCDPWPFRLAIEAERLPNCPVPYDGKAMSGTKILWLQVIIVFGIVIAGDLGRDPMDRLAARLSAGTGQPMVALGGHAHLSAAGVFLVVVRL